MLNISLQIDKSISATLQSSSDILNNIKNWPTTDWSPTIKNLKNTDRNPPHSLVEFLATLLSSKKHSVTRSESLSHLIESYAADMIQCHKRKCYNSETLFTSTQPA